MLEQVKKFAWSLARPFYSPVTTALRRRLGHGYHDHPEMELPPPYDYIQLDVERKLHRYFHVQAQEISQIVIVGALDAGEVNRMAPVYPNAKFLCFEPNPSTFRMLIKKFEGRQNVSISEFALGKSPGKARFYEMSAAGNGSLLEPDAEKWASLTRWGKSDVSSFEVNVSTLDRETAKLPIIDLLWMDVQGAEAEVMAGGQEALKRTKSVFVEVATVESQYKGGALFHEIRASLEPQGFQCVGLGLDAWSGTGNAFFIKNFEKYVSEILR